MKKIIVILSFTLVLFGYTYRVNAGVVCYDVDGVAQTNNVSATQQFGMMKLSLTSQKTGEVVDLEGDLNGMTIGSDADGAVYLSHTVTSNDAETAFTFITLNDRAVVVGSPNGCTVPISETITNIIGGAGFTARVKSVDIVINGTINFINQGACTGVPNTFDSILGEICLKQKRSKLKSN